MWSSSWFPCNLTRMYNVCHRGFACLQVHTMFLLPIALMQVNTTIHFKMHSKVHHKTCSRRLTWDIGRQYKGQGYLYNVSLRLPTICQMDKCLLCCSRTECSSKYTVMFPCSGIYHILKQTFFRKKHSASWLCHRNMGEVTKLLAK